MAMSHEFIPQGWTRGAAIQYAPTEQAKAEGVCAIIRPYHKTPEGAARELVLPTISLHDAWKAWWFSGPVVPVDINFPTASDREQRLRTYDSRLGPLVFPDGAKTSHRMAMPGTWADIGAAAAAAAAAAPAPPVAPPPNPFTTPKPVNPFASNKPRNPFK